MIWIIITLAIAILGAIIDQFFDWPYLAFFGTASCAFAFIYWLITFIYASFRKRD